MLGFLLISLLATVSVFSSAQIASLGNLSRWAFLLTFASVGQQTDFRAIRRQSLRPFIVGALAEPRTKGARVDCGAIAGSGR